MFNWLFRRTRPASSSELADALRAAAQLADSDAARIEYTAAADALTRAIAHTRKHGDKETRDVVAYALGRAEINLRQQMSELIETAKETHILMQQVHQGQTEQGAAVGQLRAEFQNFGEAVSDRLTGLEQRMDTSETDRQALHEQNDRLEKKFDVLEQDMRAALDRALAPDRVAELIAMIERHEQILGSREAGG